MAPGFAGQPGHQGQPGYPGQGAVPGAAGYPGQQAYAGQAGYPGQQGYQGQGGYPGQQPYGQAAYAAQPGYPGQAGQPVQAAYARLDERDESVNGGSYAYVIREDKAPAPAPEPTASGPEPRAGTATRPLPAAPAQPAPAQPAPVQQAGEPEHARGVFEPPPDQDPKLAGLLHIDYDLLLGDGQDSLGRLADLYETAEAIGPKALDKHFDELLERQRKLISVYFTEYRTDLAARSAG